MSDRTRVDLANVGPGLSWAFEFDENGVGHALSVDAPVDLMRGRQFVWAHVILANARTREWIRAQRCVPEDARELLLSTDGHPRLDWAGDSLWGVLLDVEREFGASSEEPTDLQFVLRPQFLLTARHHSVVSASFVKNRVEDGAVFEDTASLFERLLVAGADSVGAAAHRIALEIDGIEDRVLSETVSDESGKLLRLRRSISNRIALCRRR